MLFTIPTRMNGTFNIDNKITPTVLVIIINVFYCNSMHIVILSTIENSPYGKYSGLNIKQYKTNNVVQNTRRVPTHHAKIIRNLKLIKRNFALKINKISLSLVLIKYSS